MLTAHNDAEMIEWILLSVNIKCRGCSALLSVISHVGVGSKCPLDHTPLDHWLRVQWFYHWASNLTTGQTT